MIALTICWKLTVQNIILIGLVLTYLLYYVMGVTFFRTQYTCNSLQLTVKEVKHVKIQRTCKTKVKISFCFICNNKSSCR